MAGKTVLIVAGAIGVGAVAPFAAGQYTVITNASPPFIRGGRLGELSDAVQSITAAGVSGPSTSFVLGPASDNRGAASTVLIGHTVLQTGAAGQGVKSVYIGGNIDPGAAATSRANNTYIGWDFTLTDAGSAHGSNVFIGQAITTAGGTDVGSTVLIGVGVSTLGGFAVGIGAGVALTGGQSVAVGRAAIANSQGTALGETASAGTARATALGWNARAGDTGIGIGFSARADTLNSICIGRDTNSSGFANVICVGVGTPAFEVNSFSVGGGATAITVVRFGPNTLGGYAGLSFFFPSAGAGADQAASSVTHRGGINTGNAAGGEIRWQTSVLVAGSSSTYQAVQQVAAFRPTRAAGFAGTPSITFSNQIRAPGVAGGTLLNAPTAGDPADWWEILLNGNVRKIPCWA